MKDEVSDSQSIHKNTLSTGDQGNLHFTHVWLLFINVLLYMHNFSHNDRSYTPHSSGILEKVFDIK